MQVLGPLVEGAADDQLPEHLRQLLGAMSRARGGLVLLGGAVEGELAVEVGRGGVLLQPARARAAKAAAFAERIREFAVAHRATNDVRSLIPPPP